MNGITENPEIKSLVDSCSRLLVPTDWPARRQLAALATLENLAKRAAAIGAAGAHVSHDRLAETGMLDLCIGIAAAVDAGLVSTRPELSGAEAMQTLIIDALSALKAGREAA